MVYQNLYDIRYYCTNIFLILIIFIYELHKLIKI